jgi:hypothetical protein
MREAMIEDSLKDDRINWITGRRVNDGTGLSAGLFGDGFKLGGGRWAGSPYDCSVLGCMQSGPGKIFGLSYDKGGLVDLIVESFAGPHDRANSPWFYGPDGSIRTLSTLERFAGEALGNYTTSLVFAAPFAAAALAEQTHMPTLSVRAR